MLTADQVAELLQVSRWFVYDHAEQLGRVKLGGADSYLRDRVVAYLERQLASAEPPGRPMASGSRRQKSPREPARRVRLLEAATGLRPEKDAS